MTIPALTSATTSDQSFTKKYETHKIKKEGRGKSKTYYPFVFNDIMGLEKGDGVRVDDIILALKGHVKDGYKFNPVSPLSDEDPGYNPRPSPEDKVHVLVWVLSANATKITESVLKKMKEIREAASDLGIPQMAIVTHIDAACPETEKDLKNVYKSQYLKKKVYDISASVGIPVNCIFPVKNYSDDIDIDDDVNTLILSALRKIIDFGDDFIDCGSTLHYSTICRSYRMGGFLRFPGTSAEPGMETTSPEPAPEITADTKNLQKEVNTLKTDNKNLQKEVNTLKTDNKNLQKEVNTLKTDNKNLQKEVNTLKMDNKNLQMEVKTLKTDNKNLQKEVNTLKMDNKNLQEEVNTLKTDNKNLQKEVNTLKMDNKNLQKEVNTLKTDNKNLQEILNVLQTDLKKPHQKSAKGPNNSERSGEPPYKAKTSSSSSSFWPKATVKVFPVVTGRTFGADQVILEQVKRSPEVEITRNLQDCDFIIVFCPITSCVGSDVEAAMREDSVSSGGKPVILVLMHHTRDPDYSTDVRRWSETFQNVVLDVHVLFHETQPGLLALFKK
ncbi:uncharacterized protein LOC120570143 isoform X2 [Perca fluviatilis]|uniref:uncharacterized protein LOC120570143 isoform X2 n=1 Tax=Perca fluviatilis TaxID=8168 RepID=UPI001964E23C|nr:uncharacterized protein LOC120570143 isoform X2 [Perca fluviatilis]